jgi:hypothetical protein
MTRPPLDLFEHYIGRRLFEWAMALAMVGLAGLVFVWPHAIEASAFHWMVIILPGVYVGVFLMIFGVSRCAALIVNGASETHGPRIRIVGCIAAAVMWAQMDLALIIAFLEKPVGPPSPGIPFWFVFTIAELCSALRAANDVGRRST